MLVHDGPVELVVVRESLRARALSHRDDAVLLWVEHAALLRDWLGVRHRRAEEAVPRDAP